jgi:hypothetical protein
MSTVINGAAMMSTEWEEDYPKELAQVINWQCEMLTKQHEMITEMYQVFQALKPLVESIPLSLLGPTVMPGGPIMPPGFKR